MTNPAAANINQGVLIDLQRLNKVEYNAARNLAVIGTGQRWKNVYTQLDRYKVTVVGGRVLDVGVGGLILGSRFCTYPTTPCSDSRSLHFSQAVFPIYLICTG
jgi:hypothetical protein